MRTIILFALVIASITMYGQSDFSGSWRLNLDKTQFNETPGSPAAAKLLVEQKNGTLTLQRDKRAKEILKIDSSASIEIKEGDHKTNVSMKLAGDKRGLVETRVYTYPEGQTGIVEAKKTRTWTLSDDKNTLTIHDHIETTQEGLNYDMILIYERQ